MNKFYFVLFINLLLLASCEKSDDCSKDKIFFGNNCWDREGYTFFKAEVGDFCMPDDVLIGIDVNKELVIWKVYSDSPSGNWSVGNHGGNGTSYTANSDNHGYQVDCDHDIPKTSTLKIDDLNQVTENTESIKVNILYHPGGLNYDDPSQSATDSMSVSFLRVD